MRFKAGLSAEPQHSSSPERKGKVEGRRGPFQQFLPAAPITCRVQGIRPEGLGRNRLNKSANEGASEDFTGFTARMGTHGDGDVAVLVCIGRPPAPKRMDIIRTSNGVAKDIIAQD